MSDPEERYDHNATNVTGTPVDEESDLVPIQLWRQQQTEIERLKTAVRKWGRPNNQHRTCGCSACQELMIVVFEIVKEERKRRSAER